MRFTLVVLSLLLTSFPASSAPILTYAFDDGAGDTAKNAAGNGHDGKLTGAAWTTRDSGHALTFKGPDYEGPAKPPGTFVTAIDSAGLNPKKSIRLKASVHPTFNPVAWGGIIEKGVGYGSSFRLVMLRDGKVRATVGNEHASVDSPESLPLNAWTDIEMSFDGTKLSLSVGGKVVASDAVSPKGLASDHPIEIGRRFTGQIDDIVVEY